MSVKITDTSKIIQDLGVGPKGKVTKFVTATIAKHADPYVPFRTGSLAETVVVNGRVTSNVVDNIISYEQEYASYVYTGIRNGKPINYRTDKHANAGPYWVERMLTVDDGVISTEVQKAIDRGV